MRTALVTRPLDLEAVRAEVAHESNGAVVVFIGTVRDVNDDRPVTGIDYRAYEAMAARELECIVTEAAERFDTPYIVCEHRLGTLSLGDASVIIAVAHPRRSPAFDATRYIIEELKLRVPIWKLEHYADGTREWVDPTRSSAEVKA